MSAEPQQKQEQKQLRPDFQWEDPLDLNGLLNEEERMIRDTAHQYAQNKLMPRILDANRHENFDPAIMLEMGEMGLLGAFIDGYDCSGVSQVSYGLIAREIERVDSAIAPRCLCSPRL